MTILISQTAYVEGWGQEMNARRVTGLTSLERNAIKTGNAAVVIPDCPPATGKTGTTWRVVVRAGCYRTYYTRVPSQWLQAHLRGLE